MHEGARSGMSGAQFLQKLAFDFFLLSVYSWLQVYHVVSTSRLQIVAFGFH